MNAHVSPLTSSTPNGQLPPLDARDLISDGTTRQIDLDGQIYTLRITRAGKLILTK
nr:hemin uptake protein HemP [uncultured Celeribacter sp.]